MSIWDMIALAMLIVVIAARPLVPETYNAGSTAMEQALRDLRSNSPAVTLLFDLTIMIAALLHFAGRAMAYRSNWRAQSSGNASAAGAPPPGYRWTGLELGTALLLIAGLGSSLVASNMRIAINAAVDWLCYPLLAVVLTQVLRGSRWRGWALAVVLAAATVQAVECAEQYYVGFDETWEFYQQGKADFWAAQGLSLDSPQVELFEQRMLSREAQGFLGHSNVAGAYLALCGLAAAGLAVRQVGRLMAQGDTMSSLQQLRAVGMVVLAGGMLFAVTLTGSLGALASLAVAVVFAGAVLCLRQRIARHRRRALAIGAGVVLLGGLGVVGHGLYHGSLPNPSLDFRWKYWQASAGMFADHPLFGVGRENFGHHYTVYKTPESSEEVANPHNLFVQAACESGVVGLLAVMALVAGAVLKLSRPPALPAAPTSSRAPGDDARRNAGLTFVSIIVFAPILLTILLLQGKYDFNYLYYVGTKFSLMFLLGWLVFWPAAGAQTSVGRKNAKTAASDGPAADGIWQAIPRVCLLAGLFSLLLHDMISFALFVPGTATTFAALLGIALSERQLPEMCSRRTKRNFCVSVVAAGGLGITALLVRMLVLRPVLAATSLLHQYESQPLFQADLPPEQQPALHLLQEAEVADPIDPTYPLRMTQWWSGMSNHLGDDVDALRHAVAAIDQAIRIDPASGSYFRTKSRLFTRIAHLTDKRSDYEAAIDAARAAIPRYPSDPDGHLLLADALADAGFAQTADVGTDRQHLQDALAEYAAAIRLDASRPKWEIIRRFSDAKLAEILGQMDYVERALRDKPGKAAPPG